MKLTSRILVAAPLAAALTFGLAAVPATAAPAATSVAGVYTATVAVPKITSQPKSTTVVSGKTATFTVKASSSGLKYQWYVKSPGSTKWVKISGTAATKSSYSVKTTTKLNKAQYRVKVSNKRGSVTSSAATLAVVTTPKITSQPKDVSTPVGASTTLKVSTSGGSLSYKWQKYYSTGWKTISGATKSSFTTKATKGTNKYRVIVSNKAGKVTSRTTSVIGTKPKITTQPKNFEADTGTTVTFKVAASGSPLTYKWQRKLSDSDTWKTISGATSSTLKFTADSSLELSSYRVIVTNSVGSVTSSTVDLFVNSSVTDPIQDNQTFALWNWLGAVFDQYKEADPYDSERMDLWASIDLMNWSDEYLDPSYDIAILYQAANGQLFDSNGYFVEGNGIDSLGYMSPAEWATAAILANVPAGAEIGGVWVIYDASGDVVQYIAGF
ncbi:hypothetical protein [Timonella senegalensis]|uniref:hypothetical protein n=1 Tax=Timonella senegalensis TaxID=1465825 RepID=UPI0002FDD0C5|nr:hypothetical protein [Timonella senegalensis]